MNNRQLLFLAAGLGLLYFVYRNREQVIGTVEYVVTETGEVIEVIKETVKNLTRGERNNNPGNIVKTDINWQGEVPGFDARFESFNTPEQGIRALSKLLKNYGKQGFNTIEKIIAKYAPSNENDTNAYIQSVAKYVGINPNLPLDTSNEQINFSLTKAIIRHENGRVIYDDATILNSVRSV